MVLHDGFQVPRSLLVADGTGQGQTEGGGEQNQNTRQRHYFCSHRTKTNIWKWILVMLQHEWSMLVVTKDQSVSLFFFLSSQIEGEAGCQQSAANGNRDVTCPFVRENLVDGRTFTLCSALIRPHSMTHADATV